MRRWSLLTLIAVAALAVVPWRNAAAQATLEASPVTLPQTTALLVFTAHDPVWIAAGDGAVHVVYDLVMTNIFSSAVTIASVEVLTTDGDSLLHLAGDELRAVTRPVFGDTPTLIAPTSGAIVTLVDLPLPAAAVPKRLTHRVTYALEPGVPFAALLSTHVVDGPEAILDDHTPQVIAPPLRGKGWANVNGCCAASSHRSLRLVVNGSDIRTIQMIAIDWVKLEDGARFSGNGARNEDHFAYGEDLLAVAEGQIVFVRDDLPDKLPLQDPNLLQPGDFPGNQIVLETSPGVYAIYAHIQQGSAQVQAGDMVHTGDVLGKIGNSGGADGIEAPHLHFQLSEGPDLMTSTSLPYVIDSWTLEGSIPPEGNTPGVLVTGSRGPQSNTLPLEGSVASFAE